MCWDAMLVCLIPTDRSARALGGLGYRGWTFGWWHSNVMAPRGRAVEAALVTVSHVAGQDRPHDHLGNRRATELLRNYGGRETSYLFVAWNY